MLRTIEIAVKKPLHTTPSIIQFCSKANPKLCSVRKNQTLYYNE